MVGSGVPSENDIFGWDCLQDTCFLAEGETSQSRYTHILDFIEEGGTGTSRAVKILQRQLCLVQS